MPRSSRDPAGFQPGRSSAVVKGPTRQPAQAAIRHVLRPRTGAPSTRHDSGIRQQARQRSAASGRWEVTSRRAGRQGPARARPCQSAPPRTAPAGGRRRRPRRIRAGPAAAPAVAAARRIQPEQIPGLGRRPSRPAALRPQPRAAPPGRRGLRRLDRIRQPRQDPPAPRPRPTAAAAARAAGPDPSPASAGAGSARQGMPAAPAGRSQPAVSQRLQPGRRQQPGVDQAARLAVGIGHTAGPAGPAAAPPSSRRRPPADRPAVAVAAGRQPPRAGRPGRGHPGSQAVSPASAAAPARAGARPSARRPRRRTAARKGTSARAAVCGPAPDSPGNPRWESTSVPPCPGQCLTHTRSPASRYPATAAHTCLAHEIRVRPERPGADDRVAPLAQHVRHRSEDAVDPQRRQPRPPVSGDPPRQVRVVQRAQAPGRGRTAHGRGQLRHRTALVVRRSSIPATCARSRAHSRRNCAGSVTLRPNRITPAGRCRRSQAASAAVGCRPGQPHDQPRGQRRVVGHQRSCGQRSAPDSGVAPG